LIPAKLEILGC